MVTAYHANKWTDVVQSVIFYKAITIDNPLSETLPNKLYILTVFHYLFTDSH
jgi:hypothetical protein